jgi:hypothetical protein
MFMPFLGKFGDVVTSEWIKAQMLKTGIKLKKITPDTGIYYSYLSSITSRSEPLSQPMKATYYY